MSHALPPAPSRLRCSAHRPASKYLLFSSLRSPSGSPPLRWPALTPPADGPPPPPTKPFRLTFDNCRKLADDSQWPTYDPHIPELPENLFGFDQLAEEFFENKTVVFVGDSTNRIVWHAAECEAAKSPDALWRPAIEDGGWRRPFPLQQLLPGLFPCRLLAGSLPDGGRCWLTCLPARPQRPSAMTTATR